MESRALFSTISRSFFSLVIAFAALPAAAHSFSTIDSLERSSAIEYLGTKDKVLEFKVSYSNPGSDRFFVTVKDETGTAIFQDAFTDKKFIRKFILKGTEAKKVFFIISDKKNRFTQSFEISNQIRIVEDVVVKRMS